MFEFFKNIIAAGDYDLAKMRERLTAVFATGQLTVDEYDQLMALAGEKADPMASLAPLDERFEVVLERLIALETRVAALEASDPADPEEPATETIPDWVQPLGAHDAYNTGDMVVYNGKVYESTIDANVWAPDVYPAGWSEVEVSEAEAVEDDNA